MVAGVALGALALGIVVWVGVHALFIDAQVEVPVAAAAAAPTASVTDYPVRLVIPTLHVDASVQQAGVVAGGRMAAPTNFTDVAWYKYGTVPGMTGSAVIDGHLDNGLGLSGVFKNLSTLAPGDDVQVITESGKTLTFSVVKVATYPYDSLPASIFTADDAARLNLITCTGGWIYSNTEGMTYDHRLVVYTVLKS